MHILKSLFLLLILLPSIASAQDMILFNGGIGADERESAPEAGTRLVFFVESGSYLSDVSVTVENMSGEELMNTRTNGPWLILDLPAGEYQIRAEVDQDRAQGGVIVVNEGKSQEFAYRFTDQ